MAVKKFSRKFAENDLIETLVFAYMQQCLSGGNVEYVTGSANTIGLIVGALGIDPSIIPTEAKRRTMEEAMHVFKERADNNGDTSDTKAITKEARRRAIAALDFIEHMSSIHTCNDCGYKNCPIRPKLGETVRYNCYQWRAKE